MRRHAVNNDITRPEGHDYCSGAAQKPAARREIGANNRADRAGLGDRFHRSRVDSPRYSHWLAFEGPLGNQTEVRRRVSLAQLTRHFRRRDCPNATVIRFSDNARLGGSGAGYSSRSTVCRSPCSWRFNAAEKSSIELNRGASTSRRARATVYRSAPGTCVLPSRGSIASNSFAMSTIDNVAAPVPHSSEPSPPRRTSPSDGGRCRVGSTSTASTSVMSC